MKTNYIHMFEIVDNNDNTVVTAGKFFLPYNELTNNVIRCTLLECRTLVEYDGRDGNFTVLMDGNPIANLYMPNAYTFMDIYGVGRYTMDENGTIEFEPRKPRARIARG